MQKQRALITCKNNLFKPFNNRFRSKQQFSQCKVQSAAKKFKELSASVCIRITFDEMQSSFARINDRRGWMWQCSYWRNSSDSALVSSSCVELLHLKKKDQMYLWLLESVLLCHFSLRWPTKAVAVRLRLLHRSHLKTRYFCDQWLAIDDLSRFAFFILLTSVLRAL